MESYGIQGTFVPNYGNSLRLLFDMVALKSAL